MTGRTAGPGLARGHDSAKAAGRQRRPANDGLVAARFLGPTVAGFVLFTLLPLLFSLVMAFTMWPLIGSPKFLGLKNFAKLVGDTTFRKATINTAIFVLLYVPLNLVISLGLAAWISPKIKGRSIYRVLFFIPVVMPGVASAAVFQLLLTSNGIIDGLSQWAFGSHTPNFLGTTTWSMPSVVLLSLWMGIGYNLLIFCAGLESLPSSLLEAASIDGAGVVRRFFSVKLPLLSPAIFFGAVMTIITSVQVFAQPLILTGGGPSNSSTTMVMYLYNSGFVFFKLGYAAAIAWTLFAVIMLVTALQFVGQKRWVHYDQ